MPMSEDQKWHWGEGTKYAIEAGKALFLANGAASIAILTFIGNTKNNAPAIAASMIIFAFGNLASASIFVFCYCTQLSYGNENIKVAIRWHILTYCVVIVGAASFFLGMVVAGNRFLALH